MLRYGAYSPEVIARLRWMERCWARCWPGCCAARGPVDVRSLMAQALQMGDECHNRNRAATSLLLREITPALLEIGAPDQEVAAVFRFISGNDHFFLNLSMPAGKVAADAARDIPGSTMVVAMARNGTDFGIQVSGTGDEWFTAPAPVVKGLFLPGFGADDANPDIGDSTITETTGVGGFAMAAAPAIVRFVGGDAADAIRNTLQMYEITLAEHPVYQVPVLTSAAPRPASTRPWWSEAVWYPSSTPASPAVSRASARSARAWSPRRCQCSPTPCTPWATAPAARRIPTARRLSGRPGE